MKEFEVIRYRTGTGGFQDVSSYDKVRYEGRANEYKQQVMAAAYRELIGDLRGKRVLDVGCGTGRGVLAFSTEATFAVGADASLDMLSFAATKARGRKACSFSAVYAQQLPFKSETFDVVVSLNFLHLFSVETQRLMVAEMMRVVQSRGILVLEFDNALHGLGLGMWKRWSGKERGSMPGEIRKVIGTGCSIERVSGAVLPIIWRVSSRFPRMFSPLEAMTRKPLFSRIGHRVYYKVRKH